MTITEVTPVALPNEPLFQRLFEHATERPSDTVITDSSLAVQANYVKLFADVLHMRNVLHRQMKLEDSGVSMEGLFVSLIMPVNYEFIVTVLAILSCGGGFAPIRSGNNAHHAIASMKRCQSTYLVYGSQEEQFASEIQELALAQQPPIQFVPFEFPDSPPPSKFSDLGIQLDSNTSGCLDRPAMVVFSTGTTGIPKGILHSRRFFNRPYRLPPQAMFLILTDPFHMISHMNAMIAPILGGCQLKIIDYTGGAPGAWEEMRSNRVTSFSAIPSFWEDMAWHYRNVIKHLSDDVQESYLEGARRVMYPYSTGTVTPNSVLQFWAEGLKRPLLKAFGTTELGGLALSTSLDTESDHYKCIGKPPPYITAKLSNGEHGEILVKSPTMMSGYFCDPELTKSVFDEDGFYRTGDTAYLSSNGEYIYEGRIAKSKKEPLNVVQTTLSRLPYLEDVLAAPVPFDHEFGNQMVCLIVRIKGPAVQKGSLAHYISECVRRLHVSVYGLYMKLDGVSPLAVRVQGPDDSKIFSQDDVKGLFPYSKDPTFKADVEFAVHRACSD